MGKSKKGKNPQSGIYLDKQNHKIIYVLESGVTYDMCDEIGVLNVYKNLNTQEVIVELYHHTLCTYTTFELTFVDLNKTRFANCLAIKGVLFDQGFTAHLIKYVKEQVDEVFKQHNVKYFHEKLGWTKNGDHTSGFLASKSINAVYSSVMFRNDDKIIGPKGDRAVYDNMIQNEVIPNKSLHLPLVLGFTAPLVPVIYDKSACPVLLTNFAGKSSQGKSTSLALIASVWGSGTASNTRLAIMRTFAATQNGLEAAILSNNGFPVIFDDYETASKSIDFSQLIYTLAQGESKARCGRNFSLHDTYGWRTFVGLSGESSIFDRTSSNLGLRGRIVEFKNHQWTLSKKNSINITGVVAKNYGFYGEEFVDKLSRVTLDKLYEIYDESENVINEKIPPMDNIGERIQNRMAIIRMTAVLVKKLMNLDIDVDYITDTLVENEKKRQSEPDIYQQAIEKVAEFINVNYASFVNYDKLTKLRVVPNKQIYGRIYKGNQGEIVAIIPEMFNKIMSRFNDREAIYEKWRDEGLLLVDENRRFTKNCRILDDANPTRCFCFSYDQITEHYKEVVGADIIEFGELESEDILQSVNRKSVRMIDGERYVKVPVKENEVETVRPTKPYHYEAVDLPKSQSIDEPTTTPISTVDYDEGLSVDDLFGENDA